MATVVTRLGDAVTVEVTVRLSGSLLDMEGAIQEATNAVGRCATEEALTRFDTDGRAIRLGAIKLTATAKDLTPATVSIQSQSCMPRPAVP